MYKIAKEFTMDCAHRLRDYDGPCKSTHGHTYRVIIEIVSPELDDIGMVADFGAIKALVHGRYDHSNLNEFPEFISCNPTAENLAEQIYRLVDLYLQGTNKKATVSSVKVWETASSMAEYAPY